MIQRELGRTGVAIPAIGQGTWRMGDGREGDRKAIEALRLGIELGLTLIDTAEMYGNGHAERLVGEAIRDLRSRVFVVTKVLPSHASYEGVLRAARRSLQRLGIDRIDLYLLHWPSDRYPLEETMRAMTRLVRDGLVRFVGVSNFTVEQTRQAQEALGDVPLTCNQVYYWLGERAAELRLLPFCEQQGITLMAYSPLGSGRFPSAQSRRGQVLARIAGRYGKTPHQVALNWLVSRSAAVVAIPKAVDPQHVRANAGSVGWELTPDERAELDAAFPLPPTDDPLPVV